MRDWVWGRLLAARQVAYPLPPHGHHPNFKGAAEAAARLLEHLFQTARLRPGDTVLAYPDYVLRPLRQRLLEAGVSVVVPAQHGPHYRRLESGVVDARAASSIAGAERQGELLTALPDPALLRLSLVACVAVSVRGEVLSKGYGFSLPPETHHLSAATIVHPLQVLGALQGDRPGVALYATPEAVREV